MTKEVRTAQLFERVPAYLEEFFSHHEYPWQMLPDIGALLRRLVEEGLPGYTLVGENLLLGEGVKIHKTATIEGLAILGHGTEVRPGAYLRGNVIVGERCVIGNSSELKNAIVLDGAQVPHYNYVGDSILGYRAHMGAGSICSNLKGDGKPVVIRGSESYETGLRKVGAFLGDCADVGCSCVLNPGTVIGKGTRAYPLLSLRGVFPPASIIKSQTEVVAMQ